jgi:Mn-containing catalase
MFLHDKRLQFKSKPDHPDPLFAKKLQEVIGGQWGEMTVALQYLFQGWNCRAPQKYRDMLLDIGTEEIGHVEMLCAMVAYLLEGAPLNAQEAAINSNPVMAAIFGGMNPQHAIVSGLGAMPVNSAGVPWSGAYMTASGNLLADFRLNVTAESQGRLQVARLYNMTDDAGVKEFLSFLLARDTMHQNQWMAAIQELEADGLETTPCPSSFPQNLEYQPVSYQFWNNSAGTDSAEGRWAQGTSPDGKGEFQYVAQPEPLGPMGVPVKPDPLLYGTQGAEMIDSTLMDGQSRTTAR